MAFENPSEGEIPSEGQGQILPPVKKKVRFDLAGFDQLIPGYHKRAKTDLHRRSTDKSRASVSVEETAASQTASAREEGGDAAEDEETISPGYDEFLLANTMGCTYRFPSSDITHEIHEQFVTLEKAFSGIPFVPTTEKGKALWKGSGLADYSDFKYMAATDLPTLFEEFRAQSLFYMATRVTLEEVHTLARKVNEGLSNAHLWADHLGLQARAWQNEALEHRERGTGADEELTTELRDLKLERDMLNADIIAQQEERKILESSIATMVVQTQLDARKIEELEQGLLAPQPKKKKMEVIDLTDGDDGGLSSSSSSSDESDDENDKSGPAGKGKKGDREGTPGTTITEISAGGTRHKVKRSTKVPDPPEWFGNKDPAKGKVDQIPYKVWRRKINNKREVNADHYKTESARMAMLEGFVSGVASVALDPYLDPEHPEAITTELALLQWLDNEYDDPYLRADAKHRFRSKDFVMKTGQPFSEWRNEFVATAGQIRLPKDEWKEEMHEKLAKNHFRLRDKLAAVFMNQKKSFDSYCKLALQLDADQRRTNQLRNDDNKKASTNNPSNPRGGTTPGNNNSDKKANAPRSTSYSAPTGGNQAGRSYSEAKAQGLSKEEVTRLSAEGRCFNCKEIGHPSRECPARGPRPAQSSFEDRRKAQVTAITSVWGEPSSNSEKLDKAVRNDKPSEEKGN